MQSYYENYDFLDAEHTVESLEEAKKLTVQRAVPVFKWVFNVVPNHRSTGWTAMNEFLKDVENGSTPDESQFERLLTVCKKIMDTSSSLMSSRPYNEVRDIQLDGRTIKRIQKKLERNIEPPESEHPKFI